MKKHLKEISGCPLIRTFLFIRAKLPLFCEGLLVRCEGINSQVGGKTPTFAANNCT